MFQKEEVELLYVKPRIWPEPNLTVKKGTTAKYTYIIENRAKRGGKCKLSLLNVYTAGVFDPKPFVSFIREKELRTVDVSIKAERGVYAYVYVRLQGAVLEPLDWLVYKVIPDQPVRGWVYHTLHAASRKHADSMTNVTTFTD
jgi:hypothetical protein